MKRRGLLLEQPRVINVYPSLCLLVGNARLPSREYRQERVVPFVQPIPNGRHLPLHRHGHKNVRHLSYLDAAEPRLRNAHDRHFRVVHKNRLIQHSGIPAKMPLAIGVAQDQDRMSALHIVIGWRQHSSQDRPHAQHIEIIPSDQFARSPLRLPMTRNACCKLKSRQHSIENRRVLRQPLVQRIGKNLRIVSITPNMSAFRSGRLQNDQLPGIPDRKPPQQHLIEQGKDRRVRADAQRQRQNGNKRKAGILPKHPQAVAHVLQERVHLFFPPASPLRFPSGRRNRESLSTLEGQQFYYFKRTRSKLSQADMSERITLSPTFNPSSTSIVFTELRPNLTLTRTASDPSSIILKIPIVLSACPCTGLPTYSTSFRFSSVIVPSTLKSGLAPKGRGSSIVTSTVTVPFTTDGSIRKTCPPTMPLRVSIDAFCNGATSLACVSAILISALSFFGSATRARFVPRVTRWPTSTGTSCNTPLMPARTCSAYNWLFFR